MSEEFLAEFTDKRRTYVLWFQLDSQIYRFEIPVEENAEANACTNNDLKVLKIVQATVPFHILRNVIILDFIFHISLCVSVRMQNGRTILVQFFWQASSIEDCVAHQTQHIFSNIWFTCYQTRGNNVCSVIRLSCDQNLAIWYMSVHLQNDFNER